MKKVIFWAVQLTWGLLTNILGGLIFLVLYASGHRPRRFAEMLYFEVGEDWGGFNAGFVSVVCKNHSVHTLHHEHGHFIQNFFFGPFMIFIQIASAIRYWYRIYIGKTNPEKCMNLPHYDAIWFEGQASALGYKYCNEWYLTNVCGFNISNKNKKEKNDDGTSK
jgi:hypothetical protein